MLASILQRVRVVSHRHFLVAVALLFGYALLLRTLAQSGANISPYLHPFIWFCAVSFCGAMIRWVRYVPLEQGGILGHVIAFISGVLLVLYTWFRPADVANAMTPSYLVLIFTNWMINYFIAMLALSWLPARFVKSDLLSARSRIDV